MRKVLAAMALLAFAGPVQAGGEPASPPRSVAAPKPELDRPAPKPGAAPSVCAYVDPDPNAPSVRTDCIAVREPAPQRPTEKSPPGPPGNDATPSSR